MHIQELQRIVFEKFQGTDFEVGDVSNAGGFDKNDLFKIVNKRWGKSKYEFHYEVQKSNAKGIFELRIDCHFNPYMPYQEDTHNAEERKELVAILKEIAELTVDIMPLVRTESRFNDNSLWGAKWALSDTNCVEEILEIVNRTWLDIDGLVTKYNQ